MNKYHYLLLLLVTLYLMIMYDHELPVILLLLELILPLLQHLLLFPVAKKLRLGWSSTQRIYETGEAIPVKLWIQNPAILPVLYLHLVLEIQNGLTGEKENREISVMVPAKGMIQVPLAVSSQYCGKMTVRIAGVRLWDYFHLFSKKKKLTRDYKSEVLVIPALTEVPMEISSLVKGFLADCDRYDPHEKGADPSEVFQIREYQPGDRMQQVHWKLSAARDSLLVKELSKPMVYPVILFLDMDRNHPRLLQQAVTDALSLLGTLLQKNCPACLICRQQNGTLQKLSAASEEELLPCMEAVYSGMGAGKGTSMLAEYEEQAPGERYAHLYYVTSHMEELTAEFLLDTPLAAKKTLLWVENKRNRSEHIVDILQQSEIELAAEAEGEMLVREHLWIV